MKLPDDLRRPSGGNTIDSAAHEAVKLAHQALDQFPELIRRHKFLAGGAALSSAMVALAGVAIAKRMRSGQTADEALAGVTEAELEGLRVVEVTPEPEDEDVVPDDVASDELDAVDQPATNGKSASVVADSAVESDATEDSETPHTA
jgi:hypothetical protein